VGGKLAFAEAEKRDDLDPRLERVANRPRAIRSDDAEAMAEARPEEAKDRRPRPVLEDDESPWPAPGGVSAGRSWVLGTETLA
jgi:hypothetical protein